MQLLKGELTRIRISYHSDCIVFTVMKRVSQWKFNKYAENFMEFLFRFFVHSCERVWGFPRFVLITWKMCCKLNYDFGY